MSQDRLSTEQVRAIVDAILVEEFEVDEAGLAAGKPLADLGLDSLDGVDLVVALEKAFSAYIPNMRIPEQEARSIRTPADIYARVLARQEALTAGSRP